MLRCQCPSVCLTVRMFVTEVHWRIIANLGFKFRSQFTAHCGRRAACSTAAVLLAGRSSRAMLASARLSCILIITDSKFHPRDSLVQNGRISSVQFSLLLS